ncbi:hypothetical protein DFH28DRAFT_967515 [Melampsora americana]|nr:hypothetical protein DFH28DRAFT_967515 [Melampsora americana]
MKTKYWYVLLQSFVQYNLSTHGVWGAGMDGEDELISSILSSSYMASPIRNKYDELDWKEFTTYIDNSNELTPTKSEQIIKFWRNGNEDNKRRYEADVLNYPDLIKGMNELLLSKKETWNKGIRRIFENINPDTTYSVVSKDYSFCQVLKQLMRLEEIPFEVLHTIHSLLYKMRDRLMASKGHISYHYFKTLAGNLKRTRNIHEKRYLEGIGKLELGKPFLDFVNSHKELGECGVRLTGDWPQTYQRELFQFWLSNRMKLYFETQDNPDLKVILENQVVLTALTQAAKAINAAFDPDLRSESRRFMAWALQSFSRLSDTVVNYIKSLKSKSEMVEFMAAQDRLHPYGLDAPDYGNETDDIKVITFWSTYPEIFLMIKSVEEIKPLQKAIQDLVVYDFEEMSMAMKRFLAQFEHFVCAENEPALEQFLKFYLNITKNLVKRRIAERGLNEFRKPLSKYLDLHSHILKWLTNVKIVS